MRQYVIILVLVFILLIVGCASNVETPTQTNGTGTEHPVILKSDNRQPEQLELDVWDANDIQEVKLSRSMGFGTVNEAQFGVFSEQANVDIFLDAIQTATRINGILDIVRPHYDVTFQAEDKVQSIHLWLNIETDGGMYTYVSDTGTGYTLTEESASELKRLIRDIRYSSEQAEQNGDVVNIHGNYLNLDRWDSFLIHVQQGIRDQVQVTSYTIEGDPIFYNLNYDGQSVEYSFDNTMDAYGGSQRVSTFCESVESVITEKGTEYSLVGCNGNKARTFGLLIPPQNE